MTSNPYNNPAVTPSRALPIDVESEPTAGGDVLPEAPTVPFSLSTGKKGGVPAPSNEISPIDLAKAPTQETSGIPTTEILAERARNISTNIETAKAQITGSKIPFDVELPNSATDILSEHLGRITENLTSISSRLDLPPVPAPEKQASKGIGFFLDYLTDSQKQLNSVTKILEHPPEDRMLQVSDLLTVQVKMTGIQQQVEFFTVLLGKFLNNVQTIMGIQN